MTMQKFDVTEHIREEVRRVIVASIPDETMDAMIKAEYERFFKQKENYGNVQPSPFQALVSEELTRRMKEFVSKWLDSNFSWDDESSTYKFVGQAVESLAPIVQKAIIADITQNALADLKNRLMLR